MSTEVRWRHGTAAEHAKFTGAPNEVTVNTTDHSLVVHDGRTVGGHPMPTKFTARGTGAVSRPIAEKLADFVSVKDYGAKGDGVSDDFAAFKAALAAERNIYVPPGTYKVSGTLPIGTLPWQQLVGAGKYQTTITSTSASLDVIACTTQRPGIVLSDMTITRAVTPASAAAGVRMQVIGQYVIERIESRNHWFGIVLGEVGYSLVADSECISNYSHGLLMRPTGGTAAIQWTLRRLLLQGNGGSGMFVTSDLSTSTQLSVGEWTTISTFANTGSGIAVVGRPAVPIHGVRLINSFLGTDGADELLLDSYGADHKIVGNYMEIAGNGPTGPTRTTPESQKGGGIRVSANNANVSIINNTVVGCSWSGIDVSAAGQNTIANNNVKNCGYRKIAGERSGIRVRGTGTSLVHGNISGNSLGADYQQFGIYMDNDTGAVLDNYCTNNATADITGSVTPPVNALHAGNLASGSYVNHVTDVLRNGVKILGAREKGFTAMTGTGDKSGAFAVTSVTLPQLAARVAAIQAALTTHGLIGA